MNGRLEELAAAYGVAPAPLAALLEHLAADPHAPTTVTAPEDAVDVHVADSLSGLEAAPLRTARRIADLGAGAGFPGLVLAAARPEAHVVLVESARRKAAFVAAAADRAGLDNVEVVATRAEAWPQGLGTCEAVTARALAPLAVLVEYAAPLLAMGGHLVAWKGERDAGEEGAATAAAKRLGMHPVEVLTVHPFPGARHRHLHVLVKTAETPAGFPRRPGMATKRPLGVAGGPGARRTGR